MKDEATSPGKVKNTTIAYNQMRILSQMQCKQTTADNT